MPRRSSAALAVPQVSGEPLVPQPSAGLSVPVKTIFHELVKTSPRGHFRPSDAPVLEAYAAAIATIRGAEHELAENGPVTPAGRVSPWVRIRTEAGKTIASLAMRLRLCPQARATSRATAREKDYVGPRPWA